MSLYSVPIPGGCIRFVVEHHVQFQKRAKAEKLRHKALSHFKRDARKGESDRHVFDLKPKHLFSGKRKMGKTDRR